VGPLRPGWCSSPTVSGRSGGSAGAGGLSGLTESAILAGLANGFAADRGEEDVVVGASCPGKEWSRSQAGEPFGCLRPEHTSPVL
jgi:hypothetical protein